MSGEIAAPADYSAVVGLRDGGTVEIRALRPRDRGDFMAAVGRIAPQSLYRRFFGVKRGFTEKEVEFFVNVDFIKHVAVVAVKEECGQRVIVGGGRYVIAGPGKAEVAFAVVDEHQGQGIGTALVDHLAAIARSAGLNELIADVLPDNIPMLKVFEKSGFHSRGKSAPGVVHLSLRLR